MKTAVNNSDDTATTKSGSRIENESTATTTTAEQAKRSMGNHYHSTEGNAEGGDGDNDTEHKAKRPKSDTAPEYGSQEYWDERYKRQFSAQQRSLRVHSGLEKPENDAEDAETDQDTLPYHVSVYFV